MSKKLSVIICSTDKILLKECLAHVDRQDIRSDTEIIDVDNSSGKFKSAAGALNFGASKAQGEILVFMHQDVLLEDNRTLSAVYEYLSNSDTVTLVGVAGVNPRTKLVFSNITETREKIIRYSEVIDTPQIAETLDECFLAIKKEHFDLFGFDESCCDGFHLYGAELSYNIALHGGRIICLPLKICHLSCGNVTVDFYKTAKKIGKKYKGQIKEIHATCLHIKNHPILFDLCMLRKRAGNVLRKLKLKKN